MFKRLTPESTGKAPQSKDEPTDSGEEDWEPFRLGNPPQTWILTEAFSS